MLLFKNILLMIGRGLIPVAFMFCAILPVMAEEAATDSVAVRDNKILTDSVANDTLPTIKDLEELVVERSNVVRHGITDSYIVTQEMRKGKYTAGELLRNIDGMDYNKMTEEVRYLGSKNIIILVDSIKKDEAYIKRQSPDRFDRIDIVEHPGGQYKDYDVLINYHQRPHYTGFETNIRVPFAIKPEGNGKGKEFANTNPYVDATYMYEKVTVSGSANWRWSRNASSTYSSTQYPLNGYTETMEEQDRKNPINRSRNNEVTAFVWGDYKFSEKHKLTLLCNFVSGYYPSFSNYTLNMVGNGAESKVGVNLNNITKDALNTTAGAYYNGRINSWNLSAHFNYVNASWKSQYSLDRTDGYSLLYDRKGLINYYYGLVNLNRSFNHYKWLINIAAEIMSDNKKESDIPTAAILTESSILRNIISVSGAFNPTPKWSFYADAGMAIYSGRDGGVRTTKVQPRMQINAMWTPSRDFRINGYYMIQTGMVQSAQIQAFGQFTDQFKYQEGNPELLPNLYHIGVLRFTFWRRLAIYGTIDVTNNDAFNIFTAANTDPTDPTAGYYYALGRYQNGKSKEFSIGANLYQSLSRGLSLRFDGAIKRVSATYEDYSNRVWIPSGQLGLEYELARHNFSAELNYSLLSIGGASPQEYSRRIGDMLYLILSKGFLKNSLMISAQWVAPVHIAKGDFKSWLYSPNMLQRSWGNNMFRDNNRVYITLAYRFSNGKQIQKSRLNMQSVSVGSQF